jgi:hypothetical protein
MSKSKTSSSRNSKHKTQIEQFREAARALECDDDPKAFEKRVAEIAKAKPMPRFEIMEYKDPRKIRGFYVRVIWPNGGTTMIERRDETEPAFKTQAEAQRWIVAHRDDWLESHDAKRKPEYSYALG